MISAGSRVWANVRVKIDVGQGTSMAKEPISSAECDALLNELEAKLARLRALYEQYFLGIERLPPTTARKEVFRMVQRLEGGYIRNTAQKFRMRSRVQRFNSYKTY